MPVVWLQSWLRGIGRICFWRITCFWSVHKGKEIRLAPDLEFSVDIGQVLFDRLVRDKESLSDVRAILSGQDQVDNLFFPLGDGELFDAIGEILVRPT